MGSPIYSIVANLFIEEFEVKTISTAPYPPRPWVRYVEDTFVIQKAEHSQQFLQHITSIDPRMQLTAEVPNTNRAIPFLDTLVTPRPDSTLLTSVYRKPTHKDQYFHWDSHHNLSAKYSVVNTLTHRARPVCTNAQLLWKEDEHVRKALLRCKYSIWALNRLQINNNHKYSIAQAPKKTTSTVKTKATITVSIWWYTRLRA